MTRLLTPVAPATAAVLAVVLAGCASGGGDDGRLSVVATTTQAADLARSVGGSRVRVTGLLAPNADPHDYEVRPGDVKALVGADLVVRSGGDLDGWLDGAIDGAGTDAPLLTLIDHVHRLGDDPHWWQDPRNGELAASALGDAFARADPPGAARYADAARRYGDRLRALDAAIARCLGSIPAGRRKLVTTHDALGYYARRYDVTVVGTVIGSLSTRGQPSAGDVARLVDTIRSEGVRAIFAESSVNPRVEDAIAHETGARVGRALWADTLGPAGSGGATYLASLTANTRALADGLGAERASCRLPE